MAWASVTGAIDYSTDDGSLRFRLREDIVLDVLASQRNYDWQQWLATRSAIMARGTSWLVPESSAKVSKEFTELLRKAETSAIAAVYPYQDLAERADSGELEDRGAQMLEAYRRHFGGDPGSAEAEATIQRMREEYLPPEDNSTEDPAATAGRALAAHHNFAKLMRPRRP